jgi:hypothetical protein
MIVRVMGEGQYRVDADLAGQLNELDEQAEAAVGRGDAAELGRVLEQLAELVRSEGTRLDDADLSPSDAIVPPSDLSLDEAKELLSGEGLIPDLPS